MNTFDDKLYDVVKDVETLNQKVESLSNGSNIISSQISDRISEYITHSSITVNITPDQGLFQFTDKPIETGPYVGRCHLSCSGTTTFTLQYNNQTFQLNSNTTNNQDHPLGDLLIMKGNSDIAIHLPVSFNEPLTLKFSNIKSGTTSYSDTTIICNPPVPLTNMSDDKVMTANAVSQFTTQFQTTGDLVNRTYPKGSIFFTTEDLNMDQVAQRLGGGEWGVLHTNITDTDSIFTIYAWIRTY